MNTERPLNDLYERYERGELNRPALEGAIFCHIRNQYWRYKLGGWNEADREDFIADLYPALRKAVDSYRKTGACFDAYLYSIVRWTAVGKRLRAAESATMERAYWRERSAETAGEREPPYEPADTQPSGGARVSRGRRQVLALTLKCCLMVSDDLCARIAPALGLDAGELRDKLETLRRRTSGRLLRRRDLEERAGAEYYRCVALEAKAAASEAGSARREAFLRSAARARKRLESLRAQASRVSIEATNREVAETLGIPKGTVDASLFFLKRRGAPLPGGPSGRI